MNKFLLVLISISLSSYVCKSQTMNDGLMMPEKTLCTGFLYGHDQWKNYWEGSLKRDNLNIGKLTTQSVMWYGVYGVTKNINVYGMLPYVSTKASLGTLTGLKGVQDLTLGVKYNLIKIESGLGKFSAFAAGSFSTPMTNYTPDFLPLSIGLASTNLSGRGTLNYSLKNGFYLNASGAYTWRSNVRLDRPAYFTDGTYYSTNEVRTPNVLDFIIDLGYHKGAWEAQLFYNQQNTLGGGDIRRQDMPFVSNKMNYSKVGALAMYYLPWPKKMAVRASVNYTVAGRNVGQTTSIMGGILYTIKFSKTAE
jgi:hypothetical protein